jgi:hypothetical protein
MVAAALLVDRVDAVVVVRRDDLDVEGPAPREDPFGYGDAARNEERR